MVKHYHAIPTAATAHILYQGRQDHCVFRQRICTQIVKSLPLEFISSSVRMYFTHRWSLISQHTTNLIFDF